MCWLLGSGLSVRDCTFDVTGEYQIGDVHARSCTVAATRFGGATPSLAAS
jgi:hypothetical protein